MHRNYCCSHKRKPKNDFDELSFMTDNIEKQLLSTIANAQMRSETLEIKDPALEKILLDEIDAQEKRGLFSSVVANALRSMPRNKIVFAHDSVSRIIGRKPASNAVDRHSSFRERLVVEWAQEKQGAIWATIALVILFIVIIIGKFLS